MLRKMFCLVVLASIPALYAADAQPKTATVEGELIDMGCYTSRGATGEEHASCAARCMENATPAGVLDSKGNTYTIAASSKGYSAYAAMTVRLTGAVRGSAIRPEKMEVKKDGDWQEVPLKWGAPETKE
ncbi:MAG: hypothetical protein QNK37_24860 [Acidobacteriota bacterium]|nr:hypothetical protein [Acidobacteriota bacterium]